MRGSAAAGTPLRMDWSRLRGVDDVLMFRYSQLYSAKPNESVFLPALSGLDETSRRRISENADEVKLHLAWRIRSDGECRILTAWCLAKNSEAIKDRITADTDLMSNALLV